MLTRELAKLGGVTDAFTVEGVGTFLFDVLDRRGPEPDDAFAAFCRDTVEDPRAATSPLGCGVPGTLGSAEGVAGVDDGPLGSVDTVGTGVWLVVVAPQAATSRAVENNSASGRAGRDRVMRSIVPWGS